MRPKIASFALALGLALSLCAATACGASQEPTVTIIVPWTGGELNAFKAVYEPWAKKRHIHVITESTSAIAQAVNADLAAGDQSILVDLPSPGAVRQYVDQLQPLTGINLNSYDQPWRSLAEVNGRVYAVPVKADVKSLIWYQTSTPRSALTSWKALENFSRHGTPWCLGLANSLTSGWPGADWIADILLSQYGPATYERWLAGTLSWTSPQIGGAWQEWGALMRYGAAVPGGVPKALTTAYGDANPGNKSAKMPEYGCELEHGALSATGLDPTRGYDYIPFPAISGNASRVLVSGDFMVMFGDDQNALHLLQHLAQGSTQEMWVKQTTGYAFSADNAVQPEDYPGGRHGVEYSIAGRLQPGTGLTLCFSAEDMMAPDMSAAFEQAVLDYVNNPNSLHGLLAGLQQTQQGLLRIQRSEKNNEPLVPGNACAAA
jgi:alpha-glucoside transport system substrate-binding protein